MRERYFQTKLDAILYLQVKISCLPDLVGALFDQH